MSIPASVRIISQVALTLGAVIALATVPAQAGAQGFRGVASGSISLAAVSLPKLQVTGTALVAIDTASDVAVITERVYVRSNVENRLVARATAAGSAEVQVRGVWVKVAGAAGVVVAGSQMVGETTYLVRCRLPAAGGAAPATGCGLGYDLESTDPSYPASTVRTHVARR